MFADKVTDGFQICREIRARVEDWSSIPILMLTARGEVTDRIVGLELGADDYLSKPFEPRELVARVQNILRRVDAPTVTHKKIYSFHDIELNADSHQVKLKGLELALTTMEYELLHLFLRNPGKTFTRDDLLNALRGIESSIYSRAMDTLVSRLRIKLGDTEKPPRMIKTIWGRGYAFIGGECA